MQHALKDKWIRDDGECFVFSKKRMIDDGERVCSSLVRYPLCLEGNILYSLFEYQAYLANSPGSISGDYETYVSMDSYRSSYYAFKSNPIIRCSRDPTPNARK
jgi:hypothetical protein